MESPVCFCVLEQERKNDHRNQIHEKFSIVLENAKNNIISLTGFYLKYFAYEYINR